MKPLSKLALASLVWLAAHSASIAATYTLHLTGSTAFRSSVTNAIVNYLSAPNQAGTSSPVPVTAAYKGSSINGASNQVFKGGINNGVDTLIVETDWTGSVQGIYDTANANALSSAWMDPSLNTLSTVTPAVAPATVTGGTSIASPTYTAAAAPDVNMSDVWQASTLFPTPAQTEVLANGVAVQGFVVCASKPGTSGSMPTAFVANAIPLTLTAGSNVVSCSSVVAAAMQPGYTLAPTAPVSGQPNMPPFAICTSVNVPANTFTMSVAAAGTGTGSVPVSIAYPGWTNVNAEQMRALYTDGSATLPLSQFTGVSSDSVGTIIGIGRSPDSGTRVEFTEEIGIKNETSGSQLYQIAPFNSSGVLITDSTTQVASVAPLAATTFNGVSLAAGDNGYTSGGQVQAVLDNPTLFNVKNNYFMVSPLGVSDAVNAVKGGATALTFNGEPYNQVYIQQGKYPLWSYEHMYQSSTLSGQGLTCAQGIATQISTGGTAGSSGNGSADALINGDKISDLIVYRSPITVDGAAIFNSTTPPVLH